MNSGRFRLTSILFAVFVISRPLAAQPIVYIDGPAPDATVSSSFTVAGWAVDTSYPSGTGVNTVHVWAFPAGGGPGIFLGWSYGGYRPDIATFLGDSRFTYSGYTVIASLPPGTYQVVVFAQRTVNGQFDVSNWVNIAVSPADVDHDGISDDLENDLAARFFQIGHLYFSSTDGCLSPIPKPIVFRARHPTVNGVTHSEYIVINYVALYDNDCGFWHPHSGDAESFLVFLKWNGSDWAFDSESATAHWDAQFCELMTASYNPGLVVGANKHGTYTNSSQCGCWGDDGCNDSTFEADVHLYNAGEPVDHPSPMINDLSAINSSWSGSCVWCYRDFGGGQIRDLMFITRYWVITDTPEMWQCYVDVCVPEHDACIGGCGDDPDCIATCDYNEYSCAQGWCRNHYRWDTS